MKALNKTALAQVAGGVDAIGPNPLLGNQQTGGSALNNDSNAGQVAGTLLAVLESLANTACQIVGCNEPTDPFADTATGTPGGTGSVTTSELTICEITTNPETGGQSCSDIYTDGGSRTYTDLVLQADEQ